MKRRTLVVSKPIAKEADQLQRHHGIGFSDLLRMALATGPSLEMLSCYFEGPSEEVQLQLNDGQWQQITQMTQQAQRAGLAKSQADVLRAYTRFQLNSIKNGGDPPGD